MNGTGSAYGRSFTVSLKVAYSIVITLYQSWRTKVKTKQQYETNKGTTNSFINIQVAFLNMRIFEEELLGDETLTEGVHIVVHVWGIDHEPQNHNAKDNTADPYYRHLIHVQLVHRITYLGCSPFELFCLHHCGDIRFIGLLLLLLPYHCIHWFLTTASTTEDWCFLSSHRKKKR